MEGDWGGKAQRNTNSLSTLLEHRQTVYVDKKILHETLLLLLQEHLLRGSLITPSIPYCSLALYMTLSLPATLTRVTR